MSRIFKVLLPSCWLLVFSCSSGSGSRVSPIDAFSGEPDAPTAAGGATDTSAPGTGGAQETADLAGAGGAISTGGSALDGGGDSGGGAAGTGGLPATGGSTSSAGTPSTGGTTSTGGATASGGVDAGTGSGTCGDGDPNLPPEPTIPPACATLPATQSVPAGGVPSEASLDTSAIQKALTACASGQAVKLTTGGANNAFVTGPLTLPSGVTLWVDAGTTLYATRDTKVWGAASALISVSRIELGNRGRWGY
jgi:polygalacturonase